MLFTIINLSLNYLLKKDGSLIKKINLSLFVNTGKEMSSFYGVGFLKFTGIHTAPGTFSGEMKQGLRESIPHQGPGSWCKN